MATNRVTPMSFDKLIQEISSRYHLGPKSSSLVEEALDMIAEQPGGMGGFADRLRQVGLTEEVTSWLAGDVAAPISGQKVEQALGSDVISQIANRADVTERFAKTVLGFAIPKIVSMLARSGFLGATVAAGRVDAEDHPGLGLGYSDPLTLGTVGATFSRMAVPASAVLIVLGLFGYFGSIGATHYSQTKSPRLAAAPAPGATGQSESAAAESPAADSSAPLNPARFELSNRNGFITYSGTVGDDATRTAITDALKTAFGADKISGNIQVDKHIGPAAWTKHLKTAFAHFKTPGSEAVFEGNTVSVGGTIPDSDRERIISSLKSTLGPKFALAPASSQGAATEAKTEIASQRVEPNAQGNPPAGTEGQVKLPTIYFATNSAKVPSDSKVELKRAAADIKRLPAGTLVRIAGFTDGTGQPTVNMNLSRRRADAVRQVLVDAGVNPAKLKAQGLGVFHSTTGQNVAIQGRSSSVTEIQLREDRRVELQVVRK